jgi:hypothetical protein
MQPLALHCFECKAIPICKSPSIAPSEYLVMAGSLMATILYVEFPCNSLLASKVIFSACQRLGFSMQEVSSSGASENNICTNLWKWHCEVFSLHLSSLVHSLMLYQQLPILLTHKSHPSRGSHCPIHTHFLYQHSLQRQR